MCSPDSSVIYSLYLDSLPWTAGGEPLAFYRLTQKLVEAWVQVGLDPTFVFDGEAFPLTADARRLAAREA